MRNTWPPVESHANREILLYFIPTCARSLSHELLKKSITIFPKPVGKHCSTILPLPKCRNWVCHRGDTVRVRNRFWNRQLKRIGYPFRQISNRNSTNLVLVQIHVHVKSTQDFKCLTLRSPLFQRVLWSLSSSHLDSRSPICLILVRENVFF